MCFSFSVFLFLCASWSAFIRCRSSKNHQFDIMLRSKCHIHSSVSQIVHQQFMRDDRKLSGNLHEAACRLCGNKYLPQIHINLHKIFSLNILRNLHYFADLLQDRACLNLESQLQQSGVSWAPAKGSRNHRNGNPWGQFSFFNVEINAFFKNYCLEASIQSHAVGFSIYCVRHKSHFLHRERFSKAAITLKGISNWRTAW